MTANLNRHGKTKRSTSTDTNTNTSAVAAMPGEAARTDPISTRRRSTTSGTYRILRRVPPRPSGRKPVKMRSLTSWRGPGHSSRQNSMAAPQMGLP